MVFQGFEQTEGVNGLLSQLFAFFMEFFAFIQSFFGGSDEEAAE